jgi:acyl-CoA thioesterase-2
MRSLLNLLELEQLDANLFRSQSHEENVQGDLFGGQVLGQSLVAAQGTVAEECGQPHSMHGYFLRAGTSSTPVIYDVDRIRDGKSFSTRRVVAIQNGKAIFNMAISFHRQEAGYSHQMAAQNLPPPPNAADLQCLKDNMVKLGFSQQRIEGMIEKSPVLTVPVFEEAYFTEQPSPPHNQYWFRCRQPLPEDATVQRAALAFATDINLIATSLFPHHTSLFSGKQMVVSLDHAIWFHQQPNINDWLLYQTDSPWSGDGRGFNRGLIYNAYGVLVASTTQEGLIRPITKQAPSGS